MLAYGCLLILGTSCGCVRIHFVVWTSLLMECLTAIPYLQLETQRYNKWRLILLIFDLWLRKLDEKATEIELRKWPSSLQPLSATSELSRRKKDVCRNISKWVHVEVFGWEDEKYPLRVCAVWDDNSRKNRLASTLAFWDNGHIGSWQLFSRREHILNRYRLQL